MANPIQTSDRLTSIKPKEETSSKPQSSPSAVEAIQANGMYAQNVEEVRRKLQRMQMYDDKKLPSEDFERLFAGLRAQTKSQISMHQKPDDFCKVSNRFGAENPGTRCVRATHVGKEPVLANRVHANYVKLLEDCPSVICSQAPERGTEEDFWTQVALHSSLIVDLTNAADSKKGSGLHAYYPEDFDDIHGSLIIKVAKSNVAQGELKYSILKRENSSIYKELKEVERLHFDQWEDATAISVAQLERLLDRIEEKQALFPPDQHLWVHCRAGVGRTGTITVALAIKHLHRKGVLDCDNYVAVIDDLILKGRAQRDVLFVQAKEQYRLLLQYAEKLIG